MMDCLIKVLSEPKEHGLFDYLAYIIIPIIVMIANIWIVNNNTNKQIENQNKETYKPRLKLVKFESIQNFNNEYNLFCRF